RSVSTTSGARGSGLWLAVAGSPSMICGRIIRPSFSSEACMTAIPNGLARTSPCPIAASTRPGPCSVTGTAPVYVVRPGVTKSTPRPSLAAVSFMASGSRRSLIAAWLVLHERANAVSSGTVPRAKSSSLGIVRPETEIDAGHGTISSGPTTPDSRAAPVVATLRDGHHTAGRGLDGDQRGGRAAGRDGVRGGLLDPGLEGGDQVVHLADRRASQLDRLGARVDDLGRPTGLGPERVQPGVGQSVDR